MQWYYANDNARQGPVSEEEFQRLAAQGIINSNTLVWRQGMANWTPYAQVAPAFPPPLVANPAVQPGLTGASAGGLQPAAAAPTYAARPVSDVGAAGLHPNFHYAGFWIRFLAKLIDIAILIGFGMLVGAVIGMGGMGMGSFDPNDPAMLMSFVMKEGTLLLVNMIVSLAYDWFFIAKFAATPGKLVFGLKIIRSDGSTLSTGRIIGRHFAEILNAFILNIGYIIAGFDDEKRTLHDHICDTRVIYAR